MAFVHSTTSRLFFNKKHLSGSIKSWNAGGKRGYGETTSLLDSGTKGIPGLMEGSLKIDGMFEQDAINDAIHETVMNAINVDNGGLCTITPAGIVLGSPAFICRADISNYEVQAGINDIVSVAIEGTPDDGIDWGVILHAHNAVTATSNDTSVDNGVTLGATANGGVASLHVTAASGTTPTGTFKVQHSTDNSVWTDLITFTAVAGLATYEYKTVSGTVNRYIRCLYTIGGTTPSYTFLMSFARR